MKVLREFADADRHLYDFGLCSAKNGFAQVDTGQDAWYYGNWANPFKLIIFSYAEGDCITTICDTEEEFATELRKIKTWNDEQGYGFRGIDPMCNDKLESKFKSIGLGDLLH